MSLLLGLLPILNHRVLVGARRVVAMYDGSVVVIAI